VKGSYTIVILIYYDQDGFVNDMNIKRIELIRYTLTNASFDVVII